MFATTRDVWVCEVVELLDTHASTSNTLAAPSEFGQVAADRLRGEPVRSPFDHASATSGSAKQTRATDSSVILIPVGYQLGSYAH